MASFNDFSSLLQLGVGTGIGLSLFRAPVDIRVSKIFRSIDAELIALRGATTPFAKVKRRDIQDLKLNFTAVRDKLDRLLLPFMVTAIIGSLLNLAALVLATLQASKTLSGGQVNGLLFITVGWFVLELLALELLAYIKLHTFSQKLRSLRERRAPPVQLPADSAPSTMGTS